MFAFYSDCKDTKNFANAAHIYKKTKIKNSLGVIIKKIATFATEFTNKFGECNIAKLHIFNVKDMNRLAFGTFLLLFSLTSMTCWAQTDSTAFRANIINNEYQLSLHFDFITQAIDVPDHDIYGPLPGYLSKKNYNFYWLITSAEIKDNKCKIQMINDYGSEDLTAELIVVNDSTYELKQLKGSPLKMPAKGKWQRLPNTLVFKKTAKK